MYRIKKDEVEIAVEDQLKYMRLQTNGVYVLCKEAEAQGIVANDTIYHLEGREDLPDAETVTVEEFSGAAALAEYTTYHAMMNAAVEGKE